MESHDVESVNPYGAGESKTGQVRRMFDSIAPAYDRMNSLMSMGMHRRWLRKAVKSATASAPREILDVATGTADVAIALAKVLPSSRITGVDLSAEMLAIGERKVKTERLEKQVSLVQGDCMALQFPDGSFDAVTVAYGVRNFEHLEAGYREMNRVLRHGGSITVIELSVPRSPFVRPYYKFYTRCIIPAVGRLMSRDTRAYSYLPESIAAVPQGEEMRRIMEQAGFSRVEIRPLFLGVCTIYSAIKD